MLLGKAAFHLMLMLLGKVGFHLMLMLLGEAVCISFYADVLGKVCLHFGKSMNIDVTVTANMKVTCKEKEKVVKYGDLSRVIKQI